MPKKSKKSADGEAPLSEPVAAPPAPVEEAQTATADAAPATKTKTARKSAVKKAAAPKAAAKPAAKKAPTRKKSTKKAATGKAVADDAAQLDAEVAAMTAIVAEEAIEANGPSEVLKPLPEPHAAETDAEDEAEAFEPEPRPPAKMERLQKILAQAGIASRRHAEELITEGRVQVNGQVVTTLGSKADPARDHIRVDGKLLHGAERQRYFVLNKPRGYVTTVSDPEGRPTVMEFFKKAGERLYPVGRLDYLSEGLLLVTNDGELANKLTRAASGVEKTYLVKVSGQPTEDEIESLREGVRIDLGKPGEGRVRTAPAHIRQVRIGENPWYEVVLIEGRNRELRKMFEEIGHFVEKIRRVGYGPLVLDLEPGQMRELDAQELNLLRLAADGKWKPKKVKTSAMLPKEAGRTVDLEAGKKGGKPFRPAAGYRGGNKPFPPAQNRPPQSEERRRPEGRIGSERPGSTNLEQPGFKGRTFAPRAGDQGQWRDAGRSTGRPAAGGDRRSFSKPPSKPFTKPAADRVEGRGFSKPPRGDGRSFTSPPADRGGDRRSFSRPQASGSSQRPFRDRPATGGGDKPRFGRPAFPARSGRAEGDAGFGERKPFPPRGNRAPDRSADRGSGRPADRTSARPPGGQGTERRFGSRPARPASGGFGGDRSRPPQGGYKGGGRSTPPEGRTGEKPAFAPRRDGTSPSRTPSRPPAGGRAAFTSTGIPRPGGARPSSGGPPRKGFQGRGPGGGSRPSGGSRAGGGSRPGFKGKPGGRGPSRGPNRGGAQGRSR